MWLPFKNKTDFELARWFIEAQVPKNHIDKYFKQELGQEESTIKSAYRLFDAVDKLESGMGMKCWKEGFVSFSEAVSQCICRTCHSNRKKGDSGWRRTRRNILEAAILFPRSDSVRKISLRSKIFCWRYGLRSCKGMEWWRTPTASLFRDAYGRLVVRNTARLR